MKAREIVKELSELLGKFPVHIIVVGLAGNRPQPFHIESEDDIRDVIQTIGLREGAMTIDRPVGEVFTEKRGYYFYNGQYHKVPPDELRESYSYDAQTGEMLEIPDNFIFC